MPKSISFYFVLLMLALGIFACEKCEECSADLSARFKFVDSTRVEIFSDPGQLSIIDLNGNSFSFERTATDLDTFYVADFRPLSVEIESPDTVLMIYSGGLVDTVNVQYTFSSDSRCCKNTLTVNRLNFLNRDVARVLKQEFIIFEAIIK